MPDTTKVIPKVTATWTVELNCECPHCKEWVDVLTTPDFWEGQKLEVAEHGTDASKNIEVECPDCSENFLIDCEY